MHDSRVLTVYRAEPLRIALWRKPMEDRNLPGLRVLGGTRLGHAVAYGALGEDV